MAEHPLWLIVIAAALGSAALVVVAGMALLRRRTWSYLFITVAIGMLLVRSLVSFLSLAGPMSVDTHHLLEHLVDVVAIALLFAAIYMARTVVPEQHDGQQEPDRRR